jgi:uncharacterized protein YbjQ (UPF0145 family)
MMLTPSPKLPGYRIVASHGLVRGNTIRARNVGRDITAALRNLVGGEITEYTKMMAEAREQAIDRMIAEAETMGANAIVCVRFTTSYIMGSASEILAFGDAVVVEKEPEVEGF